jgi:membrane dipeptidase
VTHVGATIFCAPADEGGGYHNADEAFDEAQRQLTIYLDLHERGLIQIVGKPAHAAAAPNAPQCVILIEGADCIRTPADVPLFKQAGVGIVGLSWRATRYAGGTATPGPLTAAGREMVAAIDAAGLVHDVSHLAEESFWQLLERARGPIMASHSNCRAIVRRRPERAAPVGRHDPRPARPRRRDRHQSLRQVSTTRCRAQKTTGAS